MAQERFEKRKFHRWRHRHWRIKRLGGNFPNAQQYHHGCIHEIFLTPTSISCNNHSTFSSLKGKTATGFIDRNYKTSYFCGPSAKLFHQERIRKILKRGEVNKTLPGVMNTSKVAKTETFRGDVQRIILVVTAYQRHPFWSKSTNLCYKQLYQRQGAHSTQRLRYTST